MNKKFKFFTISLLLLLLFLFPSCVNEGDKSQTIRSSAFSTTSASAKVSQTSQTQASTAGESEENKSSAAVTESVTKKAVVQYSSQISKTTATSKTETATEDEDFKNSVKGFFNRFFNKDKENETTTTHPSTTPADDYSVFDHTAFIGNSRIDSLKDYGLLPKADYYSKVGLNIRNVYDEPVFHGKTALQGLKTGSYDTVILVFGDNECAWPYTDVFIKEYSEFIDKVSAAQPHAKIYLQSVLPISKTASDSNKDEMNMQLIKAINVKIKKLAADKGVGYFGTPTGLTDAGGYLKADAASDGIHFGKKYCRLWIDYMKKYLEG